jgi:hypothetical protein
LLSEALWLPSAAPSPLEVLARLVRAARISLLAEAFLFSLSLEEDDELELEEMDKAQRGLSITTLDPLLAVVFHDIYHQHFSRFHTFIAIIFLESFILMSFTSFGVYLMSGPHYTKFG